MLLVVTRSLFRGCSFLYRVVVDCGRGVGFVVGRVRVIFWVLWFVVVMVGMCV